MTLLAPGATGEFIDTVRAEHLASALAASGEAYPPVLSTTRTIALCELAAGRVLQPLLQPGELSVGVEVNVRHSAATLPGSTVTATATFKEQQGKLYLFEVVVRDQAGEVMRGTHTRAIVEVERLLASARKRRGG